MWGISLPWLPSVMLNYCHNLPQNSTSVIAPWCRLHSQGWAYLEHLGPQNPGRSILRTRSIRHGRPLALLVGAAGGSSEVCRADTPAELGTSTASSPCWWSSLWVNYKSVKMTRTQPLLAFHLSNYLSYPLYCTWTSFHFLPLPLLLIYMASPVYFPGSHLFCFCTFQCLRPAQENYWRTARSCARTDSKHA